MRTSFIHQLTVEARSNPRVYLAVGDLGFSVVEEFAREFPERYINVGVAEQNMTGVAAGLASEGYHVFTYSIGNFSTLRCLEQIRNDVCYHGHSVTVVAVGGGMAYGNLGYSHHAVQDIAIMRTLPSMCVLAPADPGEASECVQWLIANPRPSYLRLGKAGEPSLHSVRGIGSGPLLIRPGRSACGLVSTGGVLGVALKTHELLKEQGVEIPVFSMPLLKPVTRQMLASLTGFKRLIAIEEHVVEGGLAAVLRENLPPGIHVESVCVPEMVAHHVGSQTYLRDLAGIEPASIAKRCMG